jgi:hypothetical protein
MVGVNVCAALKHTLLVVGIYFIRSFLSMWCPTDFAAMILQIRPVPVEKLVFDVSTWQRIRICGRSIYTVIYTVIYGSGQP